MPKMRERHRQAEQKRAAKKNVPQADEGRYVKLVQTDNNSLELIPLPNAIKEFIEDEASHLGTDILDIVDPNGELVDRSLPRHTVWGDDTTLWELLEDFLTNGWTWVQPEDIGALTDAPILEAPDGRVYWHEKYQIQSAADNLLQGKTVKFDGAPENKQSKSAAAKTAEDAIPAAQAPAATPAPAAAAPAAVPVPMATIPSSVYAGMSTEALSEMIKTLTSLKDFVNDKVSQQMVEAMSEELKSRPIEVDEQQKAASVGGNGGAGYTTNADTGNVLEGDKSIPSGKDFETKLPIDTKPTTTLPKDANDKTARDIEQRSTFNGSTYVLKTWSERDRQYIELFNETEDRTVFEVWDGAVTEMFEDGFLNRKDLIGSALDYAEQMGWLNHGHEPVKLTEGEGEDLDEDQVDDFEGHTASGSDAAITDRDLDVQDAHADDTRLASAKKAEEYDYSTKEPRLKELDELSWKYYDRPFVELDVDKRNELREELDDNSPEPRLASAKKATIEHRPGHKDSKGKSAPWCNVKDGKVLDSHKTKAEAEKALRDHEYFKAAFKAAYKVAGTIEDLRAAFNAFLDQEAGEAEHQEESEAPEAKVATNGFLSDEDNGAVIDGESLPSGHDEEETVPGVKEPATESLDKFAAAKTATVNEKETIDGITYELTAWKDTFKNQQALSLSNAQTGEVYLEAEGDEAAELYDAWYYAKDRNPGPTQGDFDDSDMVQFFVNLAKERGLIKHASAKTATIEHKPGHKNSEGEVAPWCNVKDGKILDSHATKEEAEKALRDHGYFKGASAKTAAEMTTSKALKLAEDTGEKLQSLYLAAKPIMAANETRPVRDAVESIYAAMTLFAEAQKVLAKQLKQEGAAEELAKSQLKPKKSGLILAAAEPEEAPAEKKASRKISLFDALVIAAVE